MAVKLSKDVTPGFKELAKIRLGIKKKSRNGNEYPAEVDYFRVEFLEGEDVAEAAFKKVYPDKPKTLRLYLPFDDIDKFWDAWLVCFRNKRMVAKAGLHPEIDDGEYYFMQYFNSDTNKWIVRDWKTRDGQPMKIDMNLNPDEKTGNGRGPVIWTNDKGEAQYLTYSGTLRVMIREIANLLGYATMHTGSVRNIRNISAELAGIQSMAQQYGDGELHGIPVVLTRRGEDSVIPGSNASTTKYFVHIGVDPEWAQAVAARAQLEAINAARGNMLLEPGEAEDWDDTPPPEEDSDILDGDFSEDEDDAPAGEGDNKYEPGHVRTYPELEALGAELDMDKAQIREVWRKHEEDIGKAYDALLKNFPPDMGKKG